MNKAEALSALARDRHVIDREQTFVVDRFRPEDANGVARLVYAVYGDGYPVETYYIPERIIEANRDGRLYSVVARTPSGDIVGHEALYRSSPAFPGLYEVGQGLVLRDYRNSFAFFKMNRLLLQEVCHEAGIDAFFGEAVCHHVATQKSSRIEGANECALEIDLMPADSYEREAPGYGRVSCLILARSLRDREQTLFVPVPYRQAVDLVLPHLSLSRRVCTPETDWQHNRATVIQTSVFAGAGVQRSNISQIGADFSGHLDRIDIEGRALGVVVSQIFLNAGDPAIGVAVDVLRTRGYFLGGLVPRWFDSDGFLMQKLEIEPGFDKMVLHSDRSKALRDLVRADWQRASQDRIPSP